MEAVADPSSVVAFYDRHPITAAEILRKVETERGSLENLTAADLYAHDQDHYGGLPANDVLYDRAGIDAGSRVLDLCAGLAGPARYCAAVRRAFVTALELNEERAAGAERLNTLTGMELRVRVVQGDAQALLFDDASFDAVVAQEAFLHIPDKEALLAQAYRVLAPGGRIAFTDWIAKPGLSDADRTALREGIAAVGIESIEDYRALIEGAGFVAVETEDLSREWEMILRERLAMYERLRDEAKTADAADPHAGYVTAYRHFVELVGSGALGGGRFSAVR